MTDGAAKTLMRSGNQALMDRALPRLTSRDPATAWTSGQWMTERTGGSDVAICETVAKAREDGTFGLYGTKWFTSATTSQMALTLGRPEGNPPGGSGLALFYVEVRKADQTMNGISIHRLKDKLGTRHVPTAELGLEGTIATPVMGLRDGIKNITPMLSITRTWNAVCAVSNMRRVVDLARSYARKRVAFGAPLAEKPLHVDTLAWLQAETMGAFLLTFRAVELLGKEEAGEATEREAELLRLLSPIVKLVTARQGVTVATEGIEAFGGAGYVEDTGLPAIVRDNQVLPIWEGTTNVLSLDVLRADGKHGALRALRAEVERLTERVADSERHLARAAMDAIDAALGWREEAAAQGLGTVEAGARRMAMTLGRALEVALLLDHGAWQAEQGKPPTASAAAARLVREGINMVTRTDAREESSLLLGL
jgi:alkylation response protein AidB-like acyl-CoA dehydrogenase